VAAPQQLLIATGFYPPDPSTTATYLRAIADAIALDTDVIVLSGTAGSAAAVNRTFARVIEIRNRRRAKIGLLRRFIGNCLLATRMFLSVLRRTRPHGVVISVTSPFTLPYAATLAAKLRGARAVTLVHDLYPEALIAAGLVRSNSFVARALRWANALLFSSSDAIIVVGRDVLPLLLSYPGVEAHNIHFIPNWTLLPIGFREMARENRFRRAYPSRFIVGLCGNLGFTHSPRTVFEAARILRNDADIHFILSGWGGGWTELKALQQAENLKNITLQDAVPENELPDFLAAADVWVIPYRHNMAGVSIPSRLYNFLAVGRAVIVASEPNSEAALAVTEEDIGWVVPPENSFELARAIRKAATDRTATHQRGNRAALAALKYSEEASTLRYREIVRNLLGR
jgi:colanic acid biosynthesis glycosyl transferase WcaI